MNQLLQYCQQLPHNTISYRDTKPFFGNTITDKQTNNKFNYLIKKYPEVFRKSHEEPVAFGGKLFSYTINPIKEKAHTQRGKPLTPYNPTQNSFKQLRKQIINQECNIGIHKINIKVNRVLFQARTIQLENHRECKIIPGLNSTRIILSCSQTPISLKNIRQVIESICDKIQINSTEMIFQQFDLNYDSKMSNNLGNIHHTWHVGNLHFQLYNKLLKYVDNERHARYEASVPNLSLSLNDIENMKLSSTLKQLRNLSFKSPTQQPLKMKMPITCKIQDYSNVEKYLKKRTLWLSFDGGMSEIIKHSKKAKNVIISEYVNNYDAYMYNDHDNYFKNQSFDNVIVTGLIPQIYDPVNPFNTKNTISQTFHKLILDAHNYSWNNITVLYAPNEKEYFRGGLWGSH